MKALAELISWLFAACFASFAFYLLFEIARAIYLAISFKL